MIHILIDLLLFATIVVIARFAYQYAQQNTANENTMEKMKGDMALMAVRQHKIMSAVQSIGLPRWVVSTIQDKFYAKANKGVFANYLEAKNVGYGPARNLSARFVSFNGNEPVRVSVTSPDRKLKDIHVDDACWVRISWRRETPLDGKVYLECSDVFENTHVEEIPVKTAIQMQKGCIVNM